MISGEHASITERHDLSGAPRVAQSSHRKIRRRCGLRSYESNPFLSTSHMKYLPVIAGVLLGLLFIMSSVVVLFNLVTVPPIPEGTPAALFMGAVGPTGYMTFIKICELFGGILVAIPRTRNLGLLLLGPIIVNILAFQIFINKGADIANPMVIFIVVLALYLLWVERHAFGGLVTRRRENGREILPV